MFSEDELVPISALQHIAFCERQCALIHVEQAWEENRLTVEGRNMHERVHERDAESRPGIRIARGLRLRSLRLGLVGVADVVEFHAFLKSEISDSTPASPIQPFPVEYKRGKPKLDDCDTIQLCAQALCLEEMLGCIVSSGALFYGTPRRRLDVDFDETLRARVEQASQRVHALIESGVTPPPVCGPKCENCSLKELCLPKETGGGRSVERYLEVALRSSI